MDSLLQDVVERWRRVPLYQDVEAIDWKPGDPLVRSCPRGCKLQDSQWNSLLPRYDAYQRTRFCRTHGFARIYVITGPTAGHHGWSPHE